MRKVLIITYYWPPAGGPGVQRWLKFSKYLPKNGVDVCVLTVDPDSATYPIIDKSLEAEVSSNISVHQTKTKEFFGAYKKATSRKGIPFSGFASEDSEPDLKEKVARFVRGNFFYPDPRKGWRKFALSKAQEIIVNEKIEVVITTGPPHSTHLIGLDLKKETNVKWIADFRDPWTDIYYYRDFYPMAITRNLERALEAKVLNMADAITTASPGFAALLSNKIDDRSKITAVTNGYDHDDLPKLKENNKRGTKIQITYTGTLSEKYPLKTFLDAFLEMKKEHKEQIVLNIVGKVDKASLTLMEASGIENNLPGYVSHIEAMTYVAKSDFVLLLIPILKGNEGIIPAKLFEYIGAAKRIIAVGPKPSDAGSIIEVNGFGKSFEPNNSKELCTWLSEQIENDGQQDKISGKNRELFSRATLAKQMAEVIRKL